MITFGEVMKRSDWRKREVHPEFGFGANFRLTNENLESSPSEVTSTSESSDELSDALEDPKDELRRLLGVEIVDRSHMLWVSLCRRRSQFRLKTFLHWLHS